MATIDVAIRVDRAAAILAGRSEHGIIPVSIDLSEFSEEERKLLALRANERSVDPLPLYDLTYRGVHQKLPTLDHADADAVHAVLSAWIEGRAQAEAAHAAKLAEQNAKLKEVYAAWLALSDDEVTRHRFGGWEVVQPNVPYPLNGQDAPPAAVTERVAALNALCKRRNQEASEQQAVQKAADAALRQAAEERMVATILQYGNESQKKRFQRNMLPNAEKLAIYRDHVFGPLDNFPRYQRISRADISRAASSDGADVDDDDEVKYETSDVDDAEADEFETFEAIETVAKAKLPPGTTCCLRLHAGGIKGRPEWDVLRLSVMVTVAEPHMPMVSREYACP